MHFTNQTFTDHSFAKEQLQQATFEHCQFIRCDFSRADLTEASFEHCQFVERGEHEGCVFQYTKLKEASFKECDLSMADFTGAEMFGIEIRDSQLKGVVLSRARFANYITHNTFFCSAYITRCNLAYADFEDVKLEECELFENRWTGANLVGASFKGSDLTNGEFSQEAWGQFDLTGANLSHVDLTGLDPRRVSLDGVTICDWQQAQLLEPLGIIVLPS
ncbi:Qnr family pentapeptide repeat protein [Photobacterium sanctipauli]|uniref:Qnr family pentapeptide repeat protein n=1 Tax=Photobacterium sanctipauli TaxID=1342794 RepID=A0A2T3P163_9GAMM|nr:Qnr family pentapeptide repeat protein [Photobacterium sanctipauli]PSW22240.1 Qnr family pentapeptide repeat protein [Photobacterium sanctipauli]